jgi:sporulation protein YlmC with PRC-barrel domain
MADEIMYWGDLRGQPIILAQQGREAGVVEDFYYEPGTQAIHALRVNAGLQGYRILLPSAIGSFGRDGVTIANENMLIDEANAGPVYQLPLGHRLLGFNVINESGRKLGVVRNLFLGIYPPVALRIAGFELDNRRISAHAITEFGEDTLTVME